MSPAFKLILGTPLNAVPKPWLTLPVPGVMVNAYELLRNGKYHSLRGERLRRHLGLSDEQELWIDSGGYQFLKRGIDPGVDKIAKVYREVSADYYISLDYPPSPRDSEHEKRTKLARTIEAFTRLRSLLRGLASEGRLVPVFHMATNSSLRLQLHVYSSFAPIAAVGGLVPYFMQLAGRGSRAKAVLFLALLRKLWDGRLHALGLASTSIIPLLKALGIESGDTQTWRHKAAYGKIVVPGLGERHVSGRRVKFGPAKIRREEEEVFNQFISAAAAKLRFSPASLRADFKARALFNAWVLLLVATDGHAYRGPSRAFARLHELARRLAESTAEAVEEKLERLLTGSM